MSSRDHGRELTNHDYDIKEEFAPQDGDLVIRKERASGFYGTPLIAYLHKMKVESLIVCGESTSGCVRASAVDAYSNGIHVTVAEECTFDRSELSHKVNLFDMHHKYADVVSLAEATEWMRGWEAPEGYAMPRPAAAVRHPAKGSGRPPEGAGASPSLSTVAPGATAAAP